MPVGPMDDYIIMSLTQVTTGGTSPKPRGGCQMVVHGDVLILYGGHSVEASSSYAAGPMLLISTVGVERGHFNTSPSLLALLNYCKCKNSGV